MTASSHWFPFMNLDQNNYAFVVVVNDNVMKKTLIKYSQVLVNSLKHMFGETSLFTMVYDSIPNLLAIHPQKKFNTNIKNCEVILILNSKHLLISHLYIYIFVIYYIHIIYLSYQLFFHECLWTRCIATMTLFVPLHPWWWWCHKLKRNISDWLTIVLTIDIGLQ